MAYAKATIAFVFGRNVKNVNNFGRSRTRYNVARFLRSVICYTGKEKGMCRRIPKTVQSNTASQSASGHEERTRKTGIRDAHAKRLNELVSLRRIQSWVCDRYGYAYYRGQVLRILDYCTLRQSYDSTIGDAFNFITGRKRSETRLYLPISTA